MPARFDAGAGSREATQFARHPLQYNIKLQNNNNNPPAKEALLNFPCSKMYNVVTLTQNTIHESIHLIYRVHIKRILDVRSRSTWVVFIFQKNSVDDLGLLHTILRNHHFMILFPLPLGTIISTGGHLHNNIIIKN